MFRKLHELQRLQSKRAGEYVPAPAAVDVKVTVSEPLLAISEGTARAVAAREIRNRQAELSSIEN